MEFPEYIRWLRQQKGLTLRQVEEQTAISNSYLSQMENGRRLASPEYLGRLAKVYGVAIDELLSRTGKYKSLENTMRVTAEELDIDESFKQIMKQDGDDLWRASVEHVPSIVKTVLVKYALRSGYGHIDVDRRWRISVKHSHLPVFASLTIDDKQMNGAVLVNRSVALKAMRKPLDVMFGIDDDACEAFLTSQNLKTIDVKGESYFDLNDVLRLQGQFPHLKAAAEDDPVVQKSGQSKRKTRKRQ